MSQAHSFNQVIYTHPVAVASYIHHVEANFEGAVTCYVSWLGHVKGMMVYIAAKELGVNPHCLNEIIHLMDDSEFSIASLKAEYKEAMRQQKQDMGV